MATISEMRVRGNVREIIDKRGRENQDDAGKSIREHDSMQKASAWGYFYKKGFFDINLVFNETNTDVTTLRFPLENPSFVLLSSVNNFQLNINSAYRFTYELEDGTITRSGVNSLRCLGASKTDGNWCAVARSYSSVKYVYVCVLTNQMDTITATLNRPLSASRFSYKEPGGIYALTPENTAHSLAFFNDENISLLTGGSANYTCLWLLVNAGDRIENITTVSGLSYNGAFLSADGSVAVRIYANAYTCEKNGTICLFDQTETPHKPVLIPENRIKLDVTDIENLDLSTINPYDGMSAVAFGTSLTYRSQTTGGYLNYLPEISGMTFDNQGIGSSKIKGNMLAAIKAYTDWSDKQVCLLEGFVNDFFYEGNYLGTWKDTTEATVCGCVRVALNWMLAQNPKMTIFLVLDHYGRDYGGVDTSSTFVNSAGDTQYEFYEEIAKVAESLGIPVIKEYAISGISENTPQYLMDNIHPTALGAEQSASVIWAAMRRNYPNKVL